MTRAFLFTLFFLLSTTVFADTTNDGGVIGVKLNGVIVVLDLIEAGVEKKPVFDPSVRIRPEYLDLLKAPGFPDFPRFPLAKKLTEIRQANPFLADALIAAFRELSWSLVDTDLPLSELTPSPIQFNPKDRTQLAIRSGRAVRLHRKSWSQLNESNKTSLIVHELIQMIIPPQELNPGISVQDEMRVRELTGYLFTSEFREKKWIGLKRFSPFDYMLSAYVQAEDGVPARILAFPEIFLTHYWHASADLPGRSDARINLLFDSEMSERMIQLFCAPESTKRNDDDALGTSLVVRTSRPNLEAFVSPDGSRSYLSFKVDFTIHEPSPPIEVIDQVKSAPLDRESCLTWARRQVAAYMGKGKKFR